MLQPRLPSHGLHRHLSTLLAQGSPPAPPGFGVESRTAWVRALLPGHAGSGAEWVCGGGGGGLYRIPQGSIPLTSRALLRKGDRKRVKGWPSPPPPHGQPHEGEPPAWARRGSAHAGCTAFKTEYDHPYALVTVGGGPGTQTTKCADTCCSTYAQIRSDTGALQQMGMTRDQTPPPKKTNTQVGRAVACPLAVCRARPQGPAAAKPY